MGFVKYYRNIYDSLKTKVGYKSPGDSSDEEDGGHVGNQEGSTTVAGEEGGRSVGTLETVKSSAVDEFVVEDDVDVLDCTTEDHV